MMSGNKAQKSLHSSKKSHFSFLFSFSFFFFLFFLYIYIYQRDLVFFFSWSESEMVSRTANVLLIGLLGVVLLATQLPSPPHGTALPDSPTITSPRIRLSDGRYLAYREKGVPKNGSNYKIIIVHGFGSSKDMNFLAPQVHTY